MDARDDGTLLSAWAEGDRAAGAKLLERHHEILYRFFRNKVSSGVEDLMQQTMLACTKAVGRFRGESGFRAFLLGIARREFLHYLRTRSRKQAPLQPLVASVAALMESPSQVAALRSEQEMVAAGMRHLPVDLQVTLELFYWEDFSVAEVAEATEVAAGTVKSRLHRGRAQLRTWIEKQEAVAPGLRSSTLARISSEMAAEP
ncbi:MAG: RNA polymerase sigma factor [Nannocystales bacterium]